jgi:uncharacterized membrane protein HdeD (DUF308 family)
MLSLGFVLFLALAFLLLVNGVRAIAGGAGKGKRQKKSGETSPMLTGIVSLIASAGLVAAAFYMFRF